MVLVLQRTSKEVVKRSQKVAKRVIQRSATEGAL